MYVDFAAFERLEVYVRGEGHSTRTRRRLRNFYREESVQLRTFQRVALMLKQRQHKNLGPGADSQSVFLKLFKHIPRLDLEMLLPGAMLRMPGLQRAKLSGSLLTTVGYVVYKIASETTKLALGFKNPMFFWGPLSLVFGYGYRQYTGYYSARQSYSLMLTQSLYYQNLDNNAGVLYRLLNEAEEQELRETVLGYAFLWRHAGEEGWTARELDDRIEDYLHERAGLDVDFEIADALEKLERFGVVQRQGDRYRAVPLGRALELLDAAWDNVFTYHRPAEAQG
jgi:hypothetical protein